MATWEDGPEYAPHERPQYFADAPVAPLEQAPPALQPAGGLPVDRPQFDAPSSAVAPLASLVPVPPEERDPSRPFDMVTTTLTSGSPWGSTGDQPFVATTPFSPSAAGPPDALGPTGAPGPPGPAPTAGAPWPVLEQPAPGGPTSGTSPGAPDPYGYPAPGTPAWFAPPPTTYGEQRQPGRVDARQVVEAATPGLCICLALGGLIYVLAPIMLVIGLFLSTRVTVAQATVRITFRIAAGAVAFFALVGLVRFVLDADPWWSFVAGWSAVICWVTLAVLLLVVRRHLARPKPPTSNPWA